MGICLLAICFAGLFRSLGMSTVSGIIGRFLGEKARRVSAVLLILVMIPSSAPSNAREDSVFFLVQIPMAIVTATYKDTIKLLSTENPEIDFTASDELVDDGILDSLTIVSLIGTLSMEYGIVFPSIKNSYIQNYSHQTPV